MDETEKMDFILQVGSSDAMDDQVDELTRQLLHELQQTDVETAELVHGVAEKGTKGDPVAIGSIAIAVLPAVLPKIVETIQSWLLRGNNRTVKFKGRINGQSLDFEGSAEDLQKILATLPKPKKQK